MNIQIFLQILASFVTAVIISLIAMPAIIQVATLKNLSDKPDNDRKRHKGIIPTLGGIGIFTAFLISFSIWGEADKLASYPFFVASLFMLFLIGVKDDILVISPLKKLGVQVLAAIEIVIGGNIMILNLDGIFGIYQIPWIAGAVLSVFIFIVLINSFNLIDGVDGLAGGVAIVISSVLGMWFLLAGHFTMAVLAIALVGSLIGFLHYNLHPAQIFMGDTGSMAVGFILVYMILQFIIMNSANPESAYYVTNAPVFALGLLIIPVVDTLRVFVLRIMDGKSPFAADFNHLHHQFIKRGIGPRATSFYLLAGNVGVILIAFYFKSLNPNMLVALILGAGFLILPIGKWFYRSSHRIHSKSFLKFFLK